MIDINDKNDKKKTLTSPAAHKSEKSFLYYIYSQAIISNNYSLILQLYYF